MKMPRTASFSALFFLIGLTLVLSQPAWSYTSQGGGFGCPNPLENTPGARVETLSDGVSFSNEAGERYRVESAPLDPKGQQALAQHGREAYLDAMLKGVYLPELVLKAV